jgi:Ca-activated chloride channel family protein
MHFVHPHALWLLLLVPALGVWWGWCRAAVALPHPSLALIRGLPGRGGKFAEGLRIGLRLAAVALLIVALARPRWPDLGTRLPAQSTSIQFVLDVSGSMAEQDFAVTADEKITRLQAAQEAFQQFTLGNQKDLPGRPDDLIGLVTFAVFAEDVCPPTLSHTTVLEMLRRSQAVAHARDAATNIGDAMLLGLNLLEESKPKHRVLILLSDGQHTVGKEVVKNARTPVEAAHVAKGLNIKVYTIAVGPDPATISNPAEQERAKIGLDTLETVAQMTGGKAFRARDAAGLRAVYREIDQAERTRVESPQYARYHEAYPWVGLGCVVLLLGGLSWETTRWRKVP